MPYQFWMSPAAKMTTISTPETLNPTKTHTQLSVTISVLNAFKLLEWIALACTLLAFASMMLTGAGYLKLLGFLVVTLGLTVFYFAFRLRVDVALFKDWQHLDVGALDDALLKINPQFQVGRTLEARLAASRELFHYGFYLLLLQLCALTVLAWFYEPLVFVF